MKRTRKADVIVAGGGVSGVAAALAAARMGKQVLLIEKTIIFGGLATGGNVIYFLPLCDGYGKQLIHGISEELLLASIQYGPGSVDEAWRKGEARYMAEFNPASFILAMDELLENAGVEIWLDTLVTGVRTDDNRVTSIECFNKSGPHVLEADCFIDATGDADLAHLAGVACNTGTNHLSSWTLQVTPDSFGKGNAERSRIQLLELKTGNGKQDVPFEGISGEGISRFVMDGRRILREQYRAAHRDADRKGCARETCYPVVLPTIANVRKTRAINGRARMDDENEWTTFPDSVGLYPATSGGEMGAKTRAWSIPYGSLLPKHMDNLLVAGRCIDSQGRAWENSRLIQVCAQTGEIAGTAAGLSLEQGVMPAALPVDALQEHLREKGHILTFEDAYGTGWEAIRDRRLHERNPATEIEDSH